MFREEAKEGREDVVVEEGTGGRGEGEIVEGCRILGGGTHRRGRLLYNGTCG